MEAVLSIFGFEITLHGKAAIIVTAIFGAIFAAFFFSICWCICGGSCPCRRRRNRWRSYTTSTPARTTRITPRTTTTTTAAATTTANNAATNSSTATNANGSGAVISPRALASIPSFVYTPSIDDDKLECTVCQAKFKEGEKGKLLTRCGHRFHAECIDKWFKSHSTCPVCQSEVGAETSELPV